MISKYDCTQFCIVKWNMSHLYVNCLWLPTQGCWSSNCSRHTNWLHSWIILFQLIIYYENQTLVDVSFSVRFPVIRDEAGFGSFPRFQFTFSSSSLVFIALETHFPLLLRSCSAPSIRNTVAFYIANTLQFIYITWPPSKLWQQC